MIYNQINLLIENINKLQQLTLNNEVITNTEKQDLLKANLF